MPNIPGQYSPQTDVGGAVNGFRATTEGLNIGANLAAAGSEIEQGAQIIQRHEELNEVSSVNSQMAEARADLTSDWQDRLSKADPNDKDLAQNFGDSVDDRLDEIGDNIQTPAGRRRFNLMAARTKMHFSQTAMAGQTELARTKAQSDYANTMNGLSSSLINDPSSFDDVLQMHSDSIDGLVQTGGIDSANAIKLKTQGESDLSKSAVMGWIKLDPKEAQSQLNNGDWDGYLNGQEKHQMLAEAQQGIHAQEIDERKRQADLDSANEAKNEQTRNDFLGKMQSNALSPDDVIGSKLPSFGSGSKEQFLQMIDRNSRDRKMTSDPSVLTNLFQDIHRPDGDPKKITDPNQLNQYFGNGLNMEGLTQMRNEIAGKKTQEGDIESKLKTQIFKTAEQRLVKANPMLGTKDPDGEENLAAWMSSFMQDYNKQRAAGKTPVELLDPSSDSYLGKSIGAFAKTPQQIMNSAAQSVRNGVPQKGPVVPEVPSRKPGETIEQWKVRTKKGSG